VAFVVAAAAAGEQQGSRAECRSGAAAVVGVGARLAASAGAISWRHQLVLQHIVVNTSVAVYCVLGWQGCRPWRRS
jgi:hypothetical protein